LPPDTPEAANPLALQAPGAPQQPQPAPIPGTSESSNQPEKGGLPAIPKKEELVIATPSSARLSPTRPPALEPIRHRRMIGEQGPLAILPPIAFGPPGLPGFPPPPGTVNGAVLVP